MNRQILLLLIFAALFIGYLVIGTNPKTDTQSVQQESENVALVGTVTAVDQSQVMVDGPTLITVVTDMGAERVIAVPSMGINLCGAAERIADVGQLAIGDVVTVRGSEDEAGVIVPCNGSEDLLTVTGKMLDMVYGYEFSYPKGPVGYVTIEDTASQHTDYVTGITLYDAQEYDNFMTSDIPRESPPAMRVRVYQNPENLTAALWTVQNASEVNYDLMIGKESEAVVGGVNAIQFMTAGLFTTDVYVVAHGSHIYVLMGDYLDSESTIRYDYDNLVQSFTFVPTPEQVGGGAKIDPRVACESALAYMSFTSGEESDAFVTACVNGDHPEVIERYIRDMGLNGASI